MKAHDLQAVLGSLPELTITSSTTEEDANAAMRPLDSFNQCMIGLTCFSGQTPWERHDDDEMLHILDGEVDVTLLTGSGPEHVIVRAGSIFVVPRGLWHRQLPRPVVKLMFITGRTDVSTAEDPRRES